MCRRPGCQHQCNEHHVSKSDSWRARSFVLALWILEVAWPAKRGAMFPQHPNSPQSWACLESRKKPFQQVRGMAQQHQSGHKLARPRVCVLEPLALQHKRSHFVIAPGRHGQRVQSKEVPAYFLATVHASPTATKWSRGASIWICHRRTTALELYPDSQTPSTQDSLGGRPFEPAGTPSRYI